MVLSARVRAMGVVLLTLLRDTSDAHMQMSLQQLLLWPSICGAALRLGKMPTSTEHQHLAPLWHRSRSLAQTNMPLRWGPFLVMSPLCQFAVMMAIGQIPVPFIQVRHCPALHIRVWQIQRACGRTTFTVDNQNHPLSFIASPPTSTGSRLHRNPQPPPSNPISLPPLPATFLAHHDHLYHHHPPPSAAVVANHHHIIAVRPQVKRSLVAAFFAQWRTHA